MPEINDILHKLQNQATNLTKGVELPYQKEIKKQYQLALESILKDLQNFHSKYDHIILDKTIDATQKIGLLHKHNRLNNIKLRILKVLNDEYKVTRTQTLKTIKETLKEGYYTQGFAYHNFLQGAGININFGMFDPNVISASSVAEINLRHKTITGYIMRNKDANGKWFWDNSLKENHAKAFKKIDQAITQGILKGDGYAKTAREVSKQIFNTKERRFALQKSVQRVITFESNKARSMANELAFDKVFDASNDLGIDVQKQWAHSFAGKDQRDGHLQMHNQLADENGEFTNPLTGNKAIQAHLFGDPAEDLNCKCDVLAKVEGLESTYDESKSIKNLSKKKYEVWKKGQENIKPSVKTDGKLDVFKPAKTIKEAEEFAVRKSQIAIPDIPYSDTEYIAKRADYSKISVDNANVINRTLFNLKSKYKTSPLQEIDMNIGTPDAAGMGNAKAIKLNPSFVRGDVRDPVKFNKDKFSRFSVSDSYSGTKKLESVVTHEYGHTVADQMFGQINGKDWLKKRSFGMSEKQAIESLTKNPKALDNVVKDKLELNVIKNYAKNSKMRKEFDSLWKKYSANISMRKDVSEYAYYMKEEFFAETFSMHNMGESLPADLVNFFKKLEL